MKYTIRDNTRLRIIRSVDHFIREWRQYRGLSIEQLAAKVKLSTSMISQLERGKTGYTQNTLERVAIALDCEPWQLLACANPGELAEMWRITMLIDRPAFQSVLRAYEEERVKHFREQLETAS